MADTSFDIVSKIDKQEVANALNTAAEGDRDALRLQGRRRLARLLAASTRCIIKANTEERALAVLDVFQTWLVKRKVSLKHLDYGGKDEKPTPRLSGKEYRLEIALKEGIARRPPRRSPRSSATRGPRRSSRQIQGDELRVTSKSRDDLQVDPEHAARARRPRHRAAVHQLPLADPPSATRPGAYRSRESTASPSAEAPSTMLRRVAGDRDHCCNASSASRSVDRSTTRGKPNRTTRASASSPTHPTAAEPP